MTVVGEPRTRLVEAARELFAERGYAATTTRVIAERAGVNEVTLFRRFGSKAGVLHAIIEEVSTQVAGTTMVAPAPASWSAEAVQSWLADLVNLEIASAERAGPLALRLAIEAGWVPEVAEVVGAGTSTNLRGLAERFAEGQAQGVLRSDVSAELLAEAFFALTSNLVLSRSLLPAATAHPRSELLASQLTSLFWSAAATHAQPAATTPTNDHEGNPG
ncbi:MAG: TetR/AcrR family transcriptional regulator [Actinobacteria bacterium]|nr:TetR/AcrR family transcriptional regulator [Actinomycetota bacterium]